MPATDERVRVGDSDADGLTADIRTSDPAADTAGMVVRIAGTVPAAALPAGAATYAAQTDNSQRTGILGANGSAIASVTNPVPTRASDGSGYVTVAVDRTTAVSPAATRLSDGAAFYKGAIAGDNMGADLRVSSAAVAVGNPVPITPGTGVTFIATGASGVALAKDSTLTDKSARVGVLGVDGTNLATAANAVPVNEASTTGAIVNTTLTLTTSGVAQNLAAAAGHTVSIRNTHATATVYTGGSLVTSANAAWKLPKDGVVSYPVANANQVWAVADADSVTIAIEVLP